MDTTPTRSGPLRYYLLTLAALIFALILKWWIVSRYGYQQAKAIASAKTRGFVEQGEFWVRYPFAMMGYVWRRHLYRKEIVPPLWLSPAELQARDLEYGALNADRRKMVECGYLKP
jgi:hypothetical protein